ncbi:DUF1830 domain-containing protein [Trichothermofontia sp.]
MVNLAKNPISSSFKDSELLLCYYTNQTQQLQVIKITDKPELNFERVIFPGQRLMFQAPPTSQLQVYSRTAVATLNREMIPCEQLQVKGALNDD